MNNDLILVSSCAIDGEAGLCPRVRQHSVGDNPGAFVSFFNEAVDGKVGIGAVCVVSNAYFVTSARRIPCTPTERGVRG